MDDAAALSPPVPLTAIPAVAEPFDDLYRRTYGSMVAVAVGLVGSRPAAEEVVQDAFAAVYERHTRLADPEPYLRVCVVNGCRRHLRRSARGRRRELDAGPVDGSAEHGYDHLLDLVRALPARQRAVVVLRYQLGLTESEIASTLGVPVGSVKSRLHRAKAQLRKELER